MLVSAPAWWGIELQGLYLAELAHWRIKMTSTKTSRRNFLKLSAGVAAVTGFPTIVSSTVFGQSAPSNRINIGAIGVGRISRGHDLPGIWKYDQARIVAVCDLDSKRLEEGKATGQRLLCQKDRQGLRRRNRLLMTTANCWPTRTLMRW